MTIDKRTAILDEIAECKRIIDEFSDLYKIYIRRCEMVGNRPSQYSDLSRTIQEKEQKLSDLYSQLMELS